MREKRGFSLIELLVVIAIIAILAAILFPVFLRARANAKKTQCVSNMKQIYGALCMYADDYDGRLTLSPAPAVSDWSEQYNGLALLYKYTRKDTIFACPLSRMYGTTAAEKEKRDRDPEPMYKLYTGVSPDKSYTLKASYHYWPQLYQEWRDPNKPDYTPAPPARLDVNPGDKTLVLWKDFGEKTSQGEKCYKRCVELRGPLVDNFLHKMTDSAGYGNGVLMLTLRGDVRFLPADSYPLYY